MTFVDGSGRHYRGDNLYGLALATINIYGFSARHDYQTGPREETGHAPRLVRVPVSAEEVIVVCG